MTPLNCGKLSTTLVAFWIEKKPSPVIAMLVATEEDEIVPWVVMVALALAVTPPATCLLGTEASGMRSTKLVPMPL
ncbi:hypothetical protein ACVWXQ_003442 [Bradyrhizobium sp. S3.14.4]